ncbi:MAG: hypothetical protein LUQ31_05545 [Methanoregula sp.]|nr:hypothetical protein [Methanoregula sp.]
MTNSTISQFKDELNSFFMLALLNMAFGALAMAFGIQYLTRAVLGLPLEQTAPVLRVLAGIIALIGFGLGLMWVISSAKVLKGITGIRREVRSRAGLVPDEMLTGWIVRMIAHYRENKKILPWMITTSRLGGCVFVALGVVTILQAIPAGQAGGPGIASVVPFIAAAINLAIGIATIAVSIGFHRYSAAWDRRLDESTQNEAILENILEQR